MIIIITIIILPKAHIILRGQCISGHVIRAKKWVFPARWPWRHQIELTEKARENAVQGLGNLRRKKNWRLLRRIRQESQKSCENYI